MALVFSVFIVRIALSFEICLLLLLTFIPEHLLWCRDLNSPLSPGPVARSNLFISQAPASAAISCWIPYRVQQAYFPLDRAMHGVTTPGLTNVRFVLSRLQYGLRMLAIQSFLDLHYKYSLP